MSTKYYIGVGGTGARIAEALLHICAAGLGPDQLGIILVDPDDSNGNLDRTKRLLGSYLDARQKMRDFTGASGFFRTELVTPKAASDVVWKIFADRNVTLASRVNYDNLKSIGSPMAGLMEVLFSEQELKTPLNEGFRGHPSIGAVIMSNVDVHEDPWAWILDRLASAPDRPKEFDVFLAGSVFGGTGAAGVPTFGAPKMLKQRTGAVLGGGTRPASKVRLGSALVLPYFVFDINERTRELEQKGQMFKRPEDFPLATRVALEYYAMQYDSRGLAFDDVYLLGDSLMQSVGTFGEGSTRQENRAHYIELAGALAAIDFFQSGSSTLSDTTSFLTAARDTTTIDWSSLPVTRVDSRVDALQEEVELRMAAFATFAFALNTEGLPVLAARPADRLEAWYQQSFKKPREQTLADPNSGLNRAAIESVAEFGTTFLQWVASLDDSASKVELFDRTKLFDYADGRRPTLLPRERNTIGTLLKSAPNEGMDRGQFHDELGRVAPLSAEAVGSGRFMYLFASAALTFCQRNYKLALPKS